MKLLIRKTDHIVSVAEIEVDDLLDAKKAIEALTNDDFARYDEFTNLEIETTIDGVVKDLYPVIQPFTPNLYA